MAVLSNYTRYNNKTTRMHPLPRNGIVVDNRGYDQNNVSVSRHNIELPGKGSIEMLMPKGSYTNFRLFGNNTSDWSYIRYHYYFDVSNEVNQYGDIVAVDPYEPDMMYGFQQPHNNGGGINWYKINNKGEIILTKSESIADTIFRPYIAGFTKTHFIIGFYYQYSYQYYYYYLFKFINKETGKMESGSWSRGTKHCPPQIMSRTPKGDVLFFSYSGEFVCVDLTQLSNHRTFPLTIKPGSKPFVTSSDGLAYNSVFGCNWIPKMHNGWHYSVAYRYSYLNKPLTFIAVKIDEKNFVYDTVVADDMVVEYKDKCNKEAAKMINHPNTESNASQFNTYNTFKLNDNYFLVIFTYSNRIFNTSAGTNYKSMWAICKVDDTHHDKIIVENCQFFNYGYHGHPIPMDNNRFMLVVEETKSQCFKVDLTNMDMVLTWEINTPNIVQASYYNGIYYWINVKTNELHYEVEGDSKRIIIELEKDYFQLQNYKDVQHSNIKVSVLNSDGQKLKETVVLTIGHPGRFNDGSNTKEVTTSVSDTITVPIEIFDGGKTIIRADIKR